MRQRIVTAVLLSLASACVAAAQTKTSGTLSCGKPDPAYMLEVGDRAGHTVGLLKIACTWTTPMQIEGVAAKDGVDVISTDGGAMKSHSTGYHVTNMANGDKIFVRFSGSDTMTKDGKPDTSVGTWSYIGGTGKLKGITGKGTYKGKPDAAGNTVNEIEGEYTLPAGQ
jgi:hypothetical protein